MCPGTGTIVELRGYKSTGAPAVKPNIVMAQDSDIFMTCATLLLTKYMRLPEHLDLHLSQTVLANFSVHTSIQPLSVTP